MSVDFMEGFSQFRTAADLDGKFTRVGDGALNAASNLEILPTGGRPTLPGAGQKQRNRVPGCIRWKGNLVNTRLEANIPSTDEIIVGFNLYWEGWNPNNFHGDDTFLVLRDDTGNYTHFTVEFDYFGNDGEDDRGFLRLQLGSGSTFFYQGDDFDDFLLLNTWYYIEIRVKVSDTAGIVELRVDGETWFKTENIDTSIGGTPDIDQIWLTSGESYPNSSWGSGAIYRISDFWAVSPTGGNQTSFQYPAIIDVLYPNAETADQDFTPQTGTDNSAMVDDLPQHDFDTTYNESNTAAHKDRFTTGDTLTDPTVGEVKAVQVQAIVKDTAASGTRTARCVIFENATEGVGTTQTLTENDFMALYHIFEDNPDTSLPWLKADVAGSEFGYEIVA
jgi:hypothetical protein